MEKTPDALSQWHGITSRATPGRPEREAQAINDRIRDASAEMLEPWDRIDDFRVALVDLADEGQDL